RIDARWRVDGVPNKFDYAGKHIQITVEDELGKIDLNTANEQLLTGLLRSLGLTDNAASAMTDRILDWRENSRSHRLNGAKDAEYRYQDYLYHPRNGPFQSVDELKLVMGVTPDLFSKIRLALTVYSGRQFIDPQFAPQAALLALPSMDSERVRTMLAAR